MGLIKKKQCRHCRRVFIPDHRNRDRQNYCRKTECRKASKAASQKKWLSKPENTDYFKGTDHVERAQAWRKKNQNLKSGKPKNVVALQDSLQAQVVEKKRESCQFAVKTGLLQDSLIMQPAIIVGLISNFIGSTLQEDISETLLRMQQSGQVILNLKKKEDRNDCKTSNIKQPATQST